LTRKQYRNDTFSVRLHGIATTLREPALVQSAKEVVTGPGEDAAKDDIARTVIEDMAPGTLYLLGAGSTTTRIAERLGFTPTLLGIDAVRDGTLVARDLDEHGLLALLTSAARTVLVLSPLGAQGFVIGRGTGPLTPPVLERIGVENIVVVATPGKLNHIAQLLVDTGKKELDVQLSQKGYLSVIIGYRISTVKKIGMQNV
jgi:predicted polyphosphate/ATP-dependent NAD kinase